MGDLISFGVLHHKGFKGGFIMGGISPLLGGFRFGTIGFGGHPFLTLLSLGELAFLGELRGGNISPSVV